MTDPWRAGSDPVLRILRAATAIALLGGVMYLILSERRTAEDLGVMALVTAFLAILLGYESLVRIPWISRNGNGKPKDDDV